jgi:membrane protein implicated in regulation of membrane protease activity
MLIVALVLAVIGLAALVTAVVTSNELIAWVCIGASVIGVLLLIVDALRERSRGTEDAAADVDDRDHRDDETTVIPAVTEPEAAEDYPDEPTSASDVFTPDVAPQEQALDPADDDPPPGAKHD